MGVNRNISMILDAPSDGKIQVCVTDSRIEQKCECYRDVDPPFTSKWDLFMAPPLPLK